MAYQLHDPEPGSIVMHGAGQDEMLRIAPDGFYVRGVKVPADERESEIVYNSFKQWLSWATLPKK